MIDVVHKPKLKGKSRQILLSEMSLPGTEGLIERLIERLLSKILRRLEKENPNQRVAKLPSGRDAVSYD